MELLAAEPELSYDHAGHGMNRPEDKKQNFKWMLCKFYKDENATSCRLGDSCAFAHGKSELTPKPFGGGDTRGVKRSATAANLPTAICVHHLKGTCNKGDDCSFSHDQDSFKKTPPATYKTTLCANYMGTGNCRRGEACGYAHGRFELRPYGFKGDFDEKIKEMPHWKTVGCQFFAKTGQCRNGDGCPFAHGDKELRMSKRSPYDIITNTDGSGMAGSSSMQPPAKMCRFFLQGDCKHGQKCQFSHGITQPTVRTDQHLDYTRDVTSAMMEPSVMSLPGHIPGMSKEHLYSEFMEFLNQKFQGGAGYESEAMLAHNGTISMAMSAQQSALMSRPTAPRPIVRNFAPTANPAAYRPRMSIQKASRESMIPMKAPRVLPTAGSGMKVQLPTHNQHVPADTFDDIF